MIAWKRLIATIMVGTTFAFSGTSAFALNVGEGGSFADMQAKLAAEQQVEIMTATTGDPRDPGNLSLLRGLKFFYNAKTKVAYIGMTEKPFNPTKMKIVAKTLDTQTGAPSVVPPAIQSIHDCQRLVSEGKVEKSNCASLATVLETAKERGMTVVQYGISADGNALFVAVNLKSGEGSIYESTTVGATVDKLPFASGKIY